MFYIYYSLYTHCNIHFLNNNKNKKVEVFIGDKLIIKKCIFN